MTVLILDVSAEIRARLAALLGEASTIRVREADNAETMFQALDTSDIDVVVLDVHLPTEDGLNVLRGIRRRRPRIVSIVLTNEASEHHRRECLSSGADFFFDKSRHFERAVNVVYSLASLLPRRVTRAS